jgi:hypothetical protein
MFLSQWKILLAAGAILATTICVSPQTHAQGFRIGNFIQAGGGQGFRMGGPRLGMHFGGGQGATIGGQNFGMRFGNGQGARFGGANYGMQFGGGQGTQIGQLYTTPNVTPGTYYYGDVRGSGWVQPTYVPQPGAPGYLTSSVEPSSPAEMADEAQVNTQVLLANTSDNTSDDLSDDFIRLSYPADASTIMKYRLNGTEFVLEPGRYVLMAKGQAWRVEFSAGEGLGVREAILTDSGNYTFRKTAAGDWELVNTEAIADSRTQVASPARDAVVNPPSEDANVFDDVENSTPQSVLVTEGDTIEKPTPEAADASQQPVEGSEADPNEVEVVPTEKPDGGGDQ